MLHGDRETAEAAAARWRRATNRRGFALLAPDVPDARRSWWQWNGDPQWLRDKIAALGDRIDRARIYAAGWSGGASYLGLHAHAWGDTFAAIVFHGGGQPPWTTDACPARTPPAYFLVGNKNPMHHLAIALREFLARCGTTKWDLVRGGDHARERRALDPAKARAILDWLATHARK